MTHGFGPPMFDRAAQSTERLIADYPAKTGKRRYVAGEIIRKMLRGWLPANARSPADWARLAALRDQASEQMQ